MKATEIHHRIPRSLLKLYDVVVWNDEPFMYNDPPTALHRAVVELEEECRRYGIDWRNISRGMLEMMIRESEVEISWEQHRRQEHDGDWARWGRKGGLKTLQLYGRDHFRKLAMKRWNKG